MVSGEWWARKEEEEECGDLCLSIVLDPLLGHTFAQVNCCQLSYLRFQRRSARARQRWQLTEASGQVAMTSKSRDMEASCLAYLVRISTACLTRSVFGSSLCSRSCSSCAFCIVERSFPRELTWVDPFFFPTLNIPWTFWIACLKMKPVKS